MTKLSRGLIFAEYSLHDFTRYPVLDDTETAPDYWWYRFFRIFIEQQFLYDEYKSDLRRILLKRRRVRKYQRELRRRAAESMG